MPYVRYTAAAVVVACACCLDADGTAASRPAALAAARTPATARRAAPSRPRVVPVPVRPATSPRHARPGPPPAGTRARRRTPLRTPPPPPVEAALAPAPAGPTAWPDLNRAIARIPTYHGTGAHWLAVSSDGYWGTADFDTATIYISPRVPANRVYDVAVHEWSHLLSVVPYATADDGIAAMRAYFGGEGMTGAERAADCMARLQGASWTHYTQCADARWRAGAARLIHGRRL